MTTDMTAELEFEKWEDSYYESPLYKETTERGDMFEAFKAGVQIGREMQRRADVEIANANRIEYPCDRWQSWHDSAAVEIATAIERGEG